MGKNYYLLSLLIPLLVAFSPSHLSAEVEEIHFGLDRGHMVAGGYLAATDKLDVGLEYYEDHPLGWALRYKTDRWQTETINWARYWQVSLRTASGNFVRIRENKDQEQILGRSSVRFGRLHLSGGLRTDRDLQDLDGHLNTTYRWNTGRQSTGWYFYEEDDDLITLNVRQNLRAFGPPVTVHGRLGIKRRMVETAGITGEYDWLLGTGVVSWDRKDWGEKQEFMTTQNLEYEEHQMETKASALMQSDQQDLHNFSLVHRLEREENRVESTLSINQYGEPFIGKGIETLWMPPLGWIRLGTGLFLEESSGVSTGRNRLYIGDTVRYPFRSFIFRLTGGVEGFNYGTGERRVELSSGSGLMYNWDRGRADVSLQGISRVGKTPFDFDYTSRPFSLIGRSEIQQEIGGGFSRFTVGYDFTKDKWMVAKGKVEFTFFDRLLTSLTAEYDPEDPPKADETTFILNLGYLGIPALQTRLLLNPALSPLQISGQASLPLGQNELKLRFDYDAESEKVRSVGTSLDLDGLGRVEFSMEPQIPKYMFHIQPLRW